MAFALAPALQSAVWGKSTHGRATPQKKSLHLASRHSIIAGSPWIYAIVPSLDNLNDEYCSSRRSSSGCTLFTRLHSSTSRAVLSPPAAGIARRPAAARDNRRRAWRCRRRELFSRSTFPARGHRQRRARRHDSVRSSAHQRRPGDHLAFGRPYDHKESHYPRSRSRSARY